MARPGRDPWPRIPASPPSRRRADSDTDTDTDTDTGDALMNVVLLGAGLLLGGAAWLWNQWKSPSRAAAAAQAPAAAPPPGPPASSSAAAAGVRETRSEPSTIRPAGRDATSTRRLPGAARRDTPPVRFPGPASPPETPTVRCPGRDPTSTTPERRLPRTDTPREPASPPAAPTMRFPGRSRATTTRRLPGTDTPREPASVPAATTAQLSWEVALRAVAGPATATSHGTEAQRATNVCQALVRLADGLPLDLLEVAPVLGDALQETGGACSQASQRFAACLKSLPLRRDQLLQRTRSRLLSKRTGASGSGPGLATLIIDEIQRRLRDRLDPGEISDYLLRLITKHQADITTILKEIGRDAGIRVLGELLRAIILELHRALSKSKDCPRWLVKLLVETAKAVLIWVVAFIIGKVLKVDKTEIANIRKELLRIVNDVGNTEDKGDGDKGDGDEDKGDGDEDKGDGDEDKGGGDGDHEGHKDGADEKAVSNERGAGGGAPGADEPRPDPPAGDADARSSWWTRCGIKLAWMLADRLFNSPE